MTNEIQTKMENIWQRICGSWENCTDTTIQSFLAECLESNIDPQYCMSWVEKHKNEIPGWSSVSQVSLNWMNQHTSTGSPISINDQNLK